MLSRFRDWVSDRWGMTPSLEPADLIREPPLPASVTRLSDGRLRVRWDLQAESVSLFTGPAPQAIDREQAVRQVAGGVNTAVLPPTPYLRPFVEIHATAGPDRGRCLLVTPRIVALPGGLNARDIGGYRTRAGRSVRWGQIYRAGTLARLPAEGIERLSALNIRWVCDLRSEAEVEARPDRLPDGLDYAHYPLGQGAGGFARLRLLRRHRKRPLQLLHILYRRILDENGEALGEILSRLADPTARPALLHCAIGKDRTGVIIALLLALLDVPNETIVADYTLSNAHYPAFHEKMGRALRRAWWVGIPPVRLRPLLLADPALMEETLAYLRQRYGSAEAYARDIAGLSADTFDRLRAELLQ